MRALSPAQNIRLRLAMQSYLEKECGIGLDGQPNVSELARRLDISQPAARAILKGGGASFATANKLADKISKPVMEVIGPFEERPGENLGTKTPSRGSVLFREFLDWFYGHSAVVQAVERYRQEITVDDLLTYKASVLPPAADPDEVMKRMRQARSPSSTRAPHRVEVEVLAKAVDTIVREPVRRTTTTVAGVPQGSPKQLKGPPRAGKN